MWYGLWLFGVFDIAHQKYGRTVSPARHVSVPIYTVVQTMIVGICQIMITMKLWIINLETYHDDQQRDFPGKKERWPMHN